MKKSSIIIISGLLCVLIALATSDLKLKTEYVNRNLKGYLQFKSLPPFHYIKDDFTGTQYFEWYHCSIHSSEKYSAGMGYFEKDLLDYYVKEDTLFIRKSPNATVVQFAYGAPITIMAGPGLKGIIAKTGSMLVYGKVADTFSISATDNARVSLSHLHTNQLMIKANGDANLTLQATDTLPSLQLELEGKSAFTNSNMIILKKNIRLGDSASLVLSGRSLADFGIKKN
jgi:hypothetical protein